jgi:broad specificity phosphatase PhoE
MHLFFIRHGQSTNNRLMINTGGQVGRSEDAELTEIGVQQAQHMARYFQTAVPFMQYDLSQPAPAPKLDHLYCSLMMRAMHTAAILSEAVRVPLHAWVDWHEVGGVYRGDPATGPVEGLPGKPRSFYAHHFPNVHLPENLGENGWWNRDMESVPESLVRARRVLDELIQRHGESDANVAVVSHGGFYNSLMCALLEMAPQSPAWLVINNTAVTRVDFVDGEPHVIFMNDTRHLPVELIS